MTLPGVIAAGASGAVPLLTLSSNPLTPVGLGEVVTPDRAEIYRPDLHDWYIRVIPNWDTGTGGNRDVLHFDGSSRLEYHDWFGDDYWRIQVDGATSSVISTHSAGDTVDLIFSGGEFQVSVNGAAPSVGGAVSAGGWQAFDGQTVQVGGPNLFDGQIYEPLLGAP